MENDLELMQWRYIFPLFSSYTYQPFVRWDRWKATKLLRGRKYVIDSSLRITAHEIRSFLELWHRSLSISGGSAEKYIYRSGATLMISNIYRDADEN